MTSKKNNGFACQNDGFAWQSSPLVIESGGLEIHDFYMTIFLKLLVTCKGGDNYYMELWVQSQYKEPIMLPQKAMRDENTLHMIT